MYIKNGNRKFAAYVLLLLVYLTITLAALIILFLAGKDAKGFDINSFTGLFIPLGSGLAAISVLFFSANAAEHFANKKDNEDKKI